METYANPVLFRSSISSTRTLDSGSKICSMTDVNEKKPEKWPCELMPDSLECQDKSKSLDELYGSNRSEDIAEDESDLADKTSKKKFVHCEENLTEYENIVDALTDHILKYFIENAEMVDCLQDIEGLSGSDSDLIKKEGSCLRCRNQSSINMSLTSFYDKSTSSIFMKNLSFKLGINKGIKMSRSETSFTTLDDKKCPGCLANFRSCDKLVLIEFKNGNSYEGKLSRYMMEGKGRYTWKDGTRFEGNFVQGVAQGTGHFIWPGKGWYFGEMMDNKRHGKGICVILGDHQEVCYYGRWKNGQRYGKGILLYGDNNWYDGEWKYDNMHGKGFRLYPTGSYYEGQWKYGKPHGYGTMRWNHTDAYTGMWKKGKMHGKGMYVWRSIEVKDFVFPAQNIYEGSYKNGKRHGFGTLLTAAGLIISTHWRSDKKDGAGRIVCRSGLVIESPTLFYEDKVNDFGNNPEIPAWNKWYTDFLKSSSMEKSLNTEQSKIIPNPEVYFGTKRRVSKGLPFEKKMCFNYTPLFSPVDTIPLWHFIETVSKKLSNENTIEFNERDIHVRLANEEKWLRKVISQRMPDLNFLYDFYSKKCCDEMPKYNCFMLRIMLWQLCKDCHIATTNMTISDLDKKVGYGSYPFDVVPMFEMIYYLLYLAYELCMKRNRINKKIPGLCGAGFDYFLTHYAMNHNNFDGTPNTLKNVCQLLPLNELYSYYISLGMPVTIKSILYKYFWVEDRRDKSEKIKESESKMVDTSVVLPLGGKNIITVDGKITFEPINHPSGDAAIPTLLEIDLQTLLSFDEEVLLSSFLFIIPKAEKRLLQNKDSELSFFEFIEFLLTLINQYKIFYACHNDETCDENTNVSQRPNEENAAALPDQYSKTSNSKIHKKASRKIKINVPVDVQDTVSSSQKSEGPGKKLKSSPSSTKSAKDKSSAK